MSGIESALSGLTASSTRLHVSTNNIANQFSSKSTVDGKTIDKPYTPQVVDQVTLSTGGVEVVLRDANPAQITVPDLTAPQGTTQMPNVDAAQELVNSSIASYDFKANLKSVQAQDAMQKTLLDIIS